MSAADTDNNETALAANPYALALRLARLFEPFRVGSAYGNQRAETADGSCTVVYGLSARSKTHANGKEVVAALNNAHRIAMTNMAAAAGLTVGQVLTSWLAVEFLHR